MFHDGITESGVNSTLLGPLPLALPRPRRRRAGVLATARAIVRVLGARRWVRHIPTWGQLRAMAAMNGGEPCSYLLDPECNFVPELLAGDEDQLGTQALCFTCRDEYGRLMELVCLRHGGAFDLLGGS